ncbi:MAG: DUF4105 domain-containing protein [Gammaproteobacteria bacterium]|nr:DUF4105 domain-containing protein [Gammaproteobacteria bacterium]
MRKSLDYIVLALLCAVFTSVEAGERQTAHTDVEKLLRIADNKRLDQHPQWLTLMHYQSTGMDGDRLESQVDDQRYFLAENGKTDSRAELQASIRGLFADTPKPLPEKDDPHCRFVEREYWLRQQLSLPAEAVPQNCTTFHQWRDRMEAYSVTLVFPASYLNSPSSMFGHTLFRFDPENIADDSSWLSFALTFAADTAESDDDAFAYAFKGIAGGYAGLFSVVPYFQKIQEYGAIENRDVWEYSLDLTPDEVERIIGHAWELREIRFDYYFFRENCAFRLLELLDYARPSLDLIEQFPRTAIPAETVKAVVNSGIVSDITFRPSVGSILQHAVTGLPREHRHWVRELEQAPDLAQSPEFLALPEGLQESIVDAANQYLTYRSRRRAMTPEMAGRRFKMLKQVNRFPAREPAAVPVPARPDSGHETGLLTVGAGREREADFVSAGLRISYHDLLDNSRGYLRGGEIQLGNVELRKYKGEKLRLERADLIQLRSLSAWHSIFDAIAWEAGAGLGRHPVIEQQKLGLTAAGAVGKSAMATDNTVAYGLIGASVFAFDEAEHSGYANLSLKSGLLYFNPFGTMQAELFAEAPQRHRSRYTLSLSQNLVLGKNHSIRATIRQDWESREDFLNASLTYRFHY